MLQSKRLPFQDGWTHSRRCRCLWWGLKKETATKEETAMVRVEYRAMVRPEGLRLL